MSLHERIEPSVTQVPEVSDRVRAAMGMLRDIAIETESDVTAIWDLDAGRRGPAIVRLTLDAPPARVGEEFSPEDLQDPRELRWRLGRVWGRLHLVRARRLLAETRELATASENAQ